MLQVTKILDEVEILVVPFINPDGYQVCFVGRVCLSVPSQCHSCQLSSLQYSWTRDRLWRKNKRVNQGSSCLGVDLNRNYNDHWNQVHCHLGM